MKKFLIVAVLAVLFGSPVFAAPGDLDTGFGTGGTVSTPLDGGMTLHRRDPGMCVQPDGKIIIVGCAVTANNGDKHFVLARYNPDGSLDTGFRSTEVGAPEDVSSPLGIVITNFTTSNDAYARRCAVGPDGKIVVVGTYVISGKKRFAVARYLSNGNRDTTFSGNGLEGLAAGGDSTESEARDVAIAPNGKIWVAGYVRDSAGRRIAVARFIAGTCASNACLDASFSTNTDGNGWDVSSVDPAGSVAEDAFAIAVQSDGKAVVGGQATLGEVNRFIIARYISGGCAEGRCLDGSSFNMPAGYIISSANSDVLHETALSIIIQGDGSIVAAGNSVLSGPTKFAVRLYNANGTLDGSFGVGGAAYIDFDLYSNAYGLAVHNGKIVVSGARCSWDGDCQTAIASLNADDGMPDETFATGGHIVSSYPKGAHGMTVQSDGKIVVAGPNGENPSGFGLARFVGFYSPSPPTPSPLPPPPPSPPPPEGSASADLAISMAAAPAIGPVLPNQLAYNVTVSNAGPDSAEGVVATITLPDNVVFVSASDACSRSGAAITCSLGTVAMGAGSPIEIRVTGSTAADMSYSASVTSATTDPNAANNAAVIITAKLSASEDPKPVLGEGDGGGCAMINGAGQKPNTLIILMLAFLISPLVIARGLKYNG